ncbi:MAG: translation initiation factor IF-2 [Candidatus Nanohaloarchaeota archaeon]|nr:translation initiation factor IF-2 [Candidatus Nanohaloarchaeota archaeon]
MADKKLRQPIISILAHVDHGKTTLLDYIRNTNVVRKEAGGITQHIGASEIPKDVLVERCKTLLKKYNISVEIPGLLFIDTPGHEAFTLLRKRGGNLADIAILVIDINEGVKPQTKESLEILKQYKTPFIIAANKIDRISGWKSYKNEDFMSTFNKQREDVKQLFYNKVYELIGQLSEYGFNADLYFNIDDFTKTLAVVPISALTGEGVEDLLTILIGLVQKYIKNNLYIDPAGVGKGVVLEVKETKGLGKTLDVILYDGAIRKNDTLLIGNIDGVVETRIKALLKPKPLQELRASNQFDQYNLITAASGFKISAPDIDNVVAGSQFIALPEKEKKNKDLYVEELTQDVETIAFEKDVEGVIVKADALGSLEAIINMLKSKGIEIKEAGIGNVVKKDVLLAETMPEEKRVIFAFNVIADEEIKELAKSKDVKIFQSPVIYHLLEKYEEYLEEVKKKKEREILESVVYPFKMKFLEHFVFRQSKPAIIGAEVEGGIVKTKVTIMNQEGKIIGTIMGLQKMGENVSEAKQGDQIAVSIDKGVVGRNIKPGDVFYPFIPKEHYRILKENIALLNDNERNILEEIKEIMKKHDKLYDVGV